MHRTRANIIAVTLLLGIVAPALFVTTEIFLMRAEALREPPPPPPPAPPAAPAPPAQPDLYVPPAPIRYPFY